jgi:S1-C subfamily serine protease
MLSRWSFRFPTCKPASAVRVWCSLALVDERGNVVGIVSAKLNARAALAASGALPENVNYAIKSSYLLSFLESVPEVSAKLNEPETKERKFEEVVKAAEQAAVLVLAY